MSHVEWYWPKHTACRMWLNSAFQVPRTDNYLCALRPNPLSPREIDKQIRISYIRMAKLTARRQPTTSFENSPSRRKNQIISVNIVVDAEQTSSTRDTIALASQHNDFRIQRIYFYYRHLCWRLFFVLFSIFFIPYIFHRSMGKSPLQFVAGWKMALKCIPGGYSTGWL